MKKNTKLIREQLSNSLKKYSRLKDSNLPFKGWIQSIRIALRMNTRQLAKRIGVARQRISAIEKEEIHGNITVNTMKKVAEALDCKFVYCLLPNTSLDNTLRKQAERVIINRMKHINQSMLLEKQELSEKEMQKSINDAIEKILISSPKTIWD